MYICNEHVYVHIYMHINICACGDDISDVKLSLVTGARNIQQPAGYSGTFVKRKLLEA